ncbi:MAG: GFA family protein [Verrucomicrobiota bacterium]
MNSHFEASCLCGGITLSYSGEVGPANYCHCEDCRRVTGSAFNIGVRVERKNLKVTSGSELKVYRSVSDRGREIERCFCGCCGSPMLTLHPAKPEYAWVKAGVINDPGVVKPTHENWVKDKVEWATIRVTESHDESRKV